MKRNGRSLNSGKFLSLLLVVVLVITLIAIPAEEIYALEESITIGDKDNPPEITVEYLGSNPKYPLVNEDIEVTYKITANKFNYSIPEQVKEVVLVLDISDSMVWCSDAPEINGTNHQLNHYHDGALCEVSTMNLITGQCTIHSGEMAGHITESGICNPSRLDMTKYSAIKFINKLSEISDLNVGLVVYNAAAEVHDLVEISYKYVDGIEVNEANRTSLIEFITNLEAKTGTNTGEGLRKAAALLEMNKESAVNKSIILMTDGNPNKFTATNKTGAVYNTSIDLIEPDNGSIKGNPENSVTGEGAKNNPVGYAKVIGNIIAENGYNNVYSIGYALGDEKQIAHINLKGIHSSMGGTENSFFATQGYAIDEIFDQIADNLKLDYKFDAKMEFTLCDGFEIVGINANDDGKVITTIPEISYQLKAGTSNVYLPNGKEEEIIYLTFNVKSSKTGSLKLFKDATIKYTDVKGQIKDISIGSPVIYISEKQQVPLIEAALTSDKYVVAQGDEAIEVTYTLTPEPFEYVPNSDVGEKEVVFLIDTSNNMDSLEKVKTAVLNRMINYFLNNKENIKFNYITYDNKVNNLYIDPTTTNDYRNALQILLGTIKKSNNDQRKLGEAIKVADDYFNEKGSDDSAKTIVIIGAGNPTDSMPNIDTSKYDFITLAINRNDDYNTPSNNYVNEYDGLKKWHDQLGGEGENYFVSAKRGGNNDLEGGTEITNINPVAPNGDIMSIMADRIASNLNNSYTIRDIKLNFDLNNNFDAISNLTDEKGNFVVEVPSIKYNATEKINEYLYKFEANPIEISFEIKVKDGAVGELEFGKNTSTNYKNYVTYTKLDKSKAKNTIDETPIIIIDEEVVGRAIKILEIEPADSFRISKYKSHIRTGTERTVVVIDDTEYVVEIEHITMPEFVGKVDKLNGMYDIVVVGKFNDTLNITEYKNKDQLNYIDYNNLDKWNNDITVRKFNELLDFANMGQLLYIDKNIQNIQVNNMSRFNVMFNNEELLNCITDFSVEELTIMDIIERYIEVSDEYKRVLFGTTSPEGDDPEANKGDASKRKMKFDITLDEYEDSSEIVDINLYLDVNGDGLFTEESIDDNGNIIEAGEVVKKLIGIPITNTNIILEYQISSDFIGYLDWKIEIVKENGVKSYVTNLQNGNKLFYRSLTGEKLPIKVLQVAPYENDKLSDNIQGNLNLGPVEQGGNLRFNLLLQQVKDYDIQIQVISMNEFNERVGNTDNELVLNGNYDMIIFGFGDTYNGQQYDINNTAAEGLKEYINTGQSVMFTHDTFFYWTSQNRVDKLLDMIGQVKKLETPLEWQTSQSKVVYQTNEALITNYPFDLDETLKVRRTHKQWYQLDLENENVVPWYTITPYTVRKDDSVSDYDNEIPQDILDELASNKLHPNDMKLDDSNRLINEASTLGYESWLWKEDTTPIDGEAVNKVNQYDVKNFYYTYSVGNIVFSGTAENTKEKFTPYPTEELKLFVNTIAKAIRGANHAPIITESNIYEGMEIDKEQEKFTFSATFTDIDNDSIRNEIYIDSVKVTDVITSINGNLISAGTNFDDYYKSGTSIEYSVPKKYYEGKDSVEIVIRAIDNGGKNGTDGAQSEKIFNIIPTILPISVSVQGNNYLVGEKLSTYINIAELNTAEKTLNSVSIKLNNPESSLLELASTSPTSLNHNLNVEDLKNAPVKCEYIFEAKESIQGYKVSGVIEYSYTNIGSNDIHSKSIPIDIPINIKEGYITTSLFNYSTETLSDNISITLNNHNKLFESMNSIRFSPLVSGEYNATLNGINEGLRVEVAGDNPTTINYDNPNAEYVFSVYNATTLIHGIYEGLSSDDIGIYEYPEDESIGREYARNTVVPFAASFNANKGSSPEIVLIPGGDFSYIQGTPSIFKIVEGNNKISLEKIGDMEIKNTMDGDRFVYKLQNVEENMKVVVMYNYELKGTEAWYTNRVLVYGNIFKDAKVKIMTDGINDSQLPDLF